MSEVSNLKLKLNAMEKDRMDFDRFRDSEVTEHILRTQTNTSVLSGTCVNVRLKVALFSFTTLKFQYHFYVSLVFNGF